MSSDKTYFTSENQPKGRGRSFKNKLLEVIKSESLAGVSINDGDETAEKKFIAAVAKRAFDSEDAQSHILLKELLSKSYTTLKPTMPLVDFDLEEGATPIQKAEAILQAVSMGCIPPDVGAMLISAAKAVIDIELGTDLKERIQALEEKIGL